MMAAGQLSSGRISAATACPTIIPCAAPAYPPLAGQPKAVKVMYEQLLPTAQHAGVPPMQVGGVCLANWSPGHLEN